MKHTRSPLISKISLMALLISMACTGAHADEYSDVSQLVRAGKLPEALTRADQYLATQPKDPQMRFIKGVIQRDSGKTAEAITTFTRLTEDYPELPEPYNNLAVLYAGQSQFDKARAALEMAIRTNPSYSTAHENLGDIYAKLASQAYNKALQLDTTNPVVPTKLALIREIFNNGSTKLAHAGTSGQQAAASPSTPPAKPPVVATAPVVPSVPPVAVQPKPVVATPTPPVASTPAPVPPVAVKAPVENTTAHATDAASSAQSKDVEAAVGKWAAAWSARDVKTYQIGRAHV